MRKYVDIYDFVSEIPYVVTEANWRGQMVDAYYMWQAICKMATEYKEADVEEVHHGHWIPVTERLPGKEKRTYWICTDAGYQCQCRWTNNIFGIGESDSWGWSIVDVPQYHKVTAWMFLPEPYEPPKEVEE